VSKPTLVHQFESTIDIPATSVDVESAMRALNVFHVGAELIPLDTPCPPELQDAHWRVNVVRRAKGITTVYGDGSRRFAASDSGANRPRPLVDAISACRS
jgi:hypothetical protein